MCFNTRGNVFDGNGGNNSKSDKTENISEDKLYCLVTDVLYLFRHVVRSAFFYDGGYSFGNCKTFGLDQCQSSMKISCLSTVVEDIELKDILNHIPDMNKLHYWNR